MLGNGWRSLSPLVGVLVLSSLTAAAQPGPTALTLDEALRRGSEAAESIAVARAELDRAHGQVAGARAGYYPTVQGSAAYQRSLRSEFEGISLFPSDAPVEEDVQLPFGQRNTWRLGLVVSQPLFDGFRTAATIASAQAAARVSQLGVRSSRAQVALAVAIAYYDAVLAERQVAIAEVTLQQAAETARETELGLSQGATPEFDVVRARVARDNQAALLAQFRAQRDVALVVLRRLVGLPLDRPLALASPLEGDDLDAMATAVRAAAGLGAEPARVAVAQAREAVTARAAALRAARAERLPAITAGSDLGLVAYQRTPFSDAWRTNWTVGLTLTLPLFDGWRRRAAIATSSAELAAARAQLASSAEAADVEAAQAAAAVAASQFTLETTQRTVGQARRAYEIATLRFEQGASTHLELVDARVQLEQAQLSVARSARDLRVARARQALLGGLPLGAGGSP